MDIITALKTRGSTRAFLDTPVDKKLLMNILDASRWATSGTNMQPWQVAVVTGKMQQKISTALLHAFQSGLRANPDYQYYPSQWSEPYKSRRFACGMALYEVLGIARDDKMARQKNWEANYNSFGAPVTLFFFLDRSLASGSLFDYGMFVENIMLAALEYGLATCPQAALAEYPDIVREHLGGSYDEKSLLCGMAMGYPDNTADINNYRTTRVEVNEFTEWFDE